MSKKKKTQCVYCYVQAGSAALPLIKKLASGATQVWDADDSTGGGKLQQLKGLWNKLNKAYL